MDQNEIELIAQKLDHARKINRPIDHNLVNLGIEEAYSVQEEGLKLRQTNGEVVTGLKIEPSENMQKTWWGYLTNQMALVPGCRFSRADSIMPKVRPHLAFMIDSHLKGKVDLEQVLMASSGVSCALEIIDSRFEGPTKIENVISDNFSTSFYLVGRKRIDPREIDFKSLQINLVVNDNIAASNPLGLDPISMVAKLSETMDARGLEIPPGMVVLTGLNFSPIELASGMDISLSIDYLGELSLSIT